MKRFWDNAAAIRGADGYFDIMLDGRPVRLPGGGQLRLPGQVLAEAVAAEWQSAGGAKGGNFTQEQVKLSSLAGTAQHRIAPNPGPTVAALTAYAGTDFLCYRAERPESLVVRQHHAWQPWLDWAARQFGGRLVVTNGVMPVTQPEAAVAALGRAVASLDPFQLAGLGVLVPSYGSLVLGLAVTLGHLPAEDAYGLTLLDEDFQEQVWGEDQEAATRRRLIAAEVALAERFIRLAAL
jgi:chaperone required for assembly of F1-ATPase